ncbi:hypothetical protein Sjap_021343 [Stephania japonica]|uniref:Phospholipase D n=1 Tax=Stephania japonica TaxID=461633 RepID=A0AAP0EM90_9MAGN
MASGSKHGEEGATSVNDGTERFMFLHGDLDLWIFEAKSLPNMDLISERMRRCFTMFGSCSSPFRRKNKRSSRHHIITSDPYVSVCLAGATVARTRVITNCENPSWDEHFCVPVAHPITKLEFQVKDNDILGAQLIGVVAIPVEKVISGNTVDAWFPVVGPYGSPLKPYPELHISFKFRTVEDNPLYKLGVGPGPDYPGVPNAYFPVRRGGNVTLYQDAHIPDQMLPEILLEGDNVFSQAKCWEDICHAILEAHHLIYIIGWSIYHNVKLEGVMQTHDEETRKFFKHSSVHCVLCPRYASNKLSIVKQQVVGTLFTHHQKCVILDTQASGNNRKITAFLGGLDLCDGRYDTPEHRLFYDLPTVFADDFHNPTLPTRTQGPRQPWHDLHCKVEGPAAYDILKNFEQRWRKAAKWRDFRLKKVTQWHDDALINLDRISWILSPSSQDDSNVCVCDEEDPENWHVQVFRSIDSGSVRGFPKVMKEAEAQNLICGKNLKIDKSIHAAYVKAIRSAQHFVYIENQYFIGSSFYWPSYKNAGADNLIPMELALKISSKIMANERFAVYILIPMWPEGVPNSTAVQEILFWQGQTMSMMYQIISQSLEKAGLSNERHPQDYLNFYCLGKREVGPKEGSSTNDLPTESVGFSEKYRRFMIYVHAKGMIVDDEYVLLGSANINQRSLDGSRDTEIAMGAYQPKYTWAKEKRSPQGQVFGYRMSLWAEHLGRLEDCFCEPHTIECVRRVNKLADENWLTYVSTKMKEMHGHLIRYPLKVDQSGRLMPIPGHELFPDVGGKVLGSSSNLPDSLTT